jgi:hypothetical protein
MHFFLHLSSSLFGAFALLGVGFLLIICYSMWEDYYAMKRTVRASQKRRDAYLKASRERSYGENFTENVAADQANPHWKTPDSDHFGNGPYAPGHGLIVSASSRKEVVMTNWNEKVDTTATGWVTTYD